MTTNTSNQSLSTLAEERIALKAQADAIAERLKAFDEGLIKIMRNAGVTKVETALGNLNLIQSNTVVWNEEVLKGLLKPAQWKRIIIEKVDKARLEAELIVGRIDEDEVSVAKSVKQSKPFLR